MFIFIENGKTSLLLFLVYKTFVLCCRNGGGKTFCTICTARTRIGTILSTSLKTAMCDSDYCNWPNTYTTQHNHTTHIGTYTRIINLLNSTTNTVTVHLLNHFDILARAVWHRDSQLFREICIY